MTNHYHHVIETTGCDDPSAAIRRAASRWAVRFNDRHGRTGALFGSRFWSRPIRGDADLLASVRYVHRNPRDIVGDERLIDYRWSSLPGLLERRPIWPGHDVGLLSELIDPEEHAASLTMSAPSDITCPREFGAPTIDFRQICRVADELTAGTNEVRHLRLLLADCAGIAPDTHLADLESVDVRTIRRRRSASAAWLSEPRSQALIDEGLDRLSQRAG